METANEAVPAAKVPGQAGAQPQQEAPPAPWKPLQAPGAKPAAPGSGLNLILDVPVQLSVELGRAKMSLREVMELREGSVIPLNKSAGEPVSLFVNEQLVARGEIVLVEDFLGVRITEMTGEAQ